MLRLLSLIRMDTLSWIKGWKIKCPREKSKGDLQEKLYVSVSKWKFKIIYIMEFLSMCQGKAFKMYSCFIVEGPSGSEPLRGSLVQFCSLMGSQVLREKQGWIGLR